MWNSERTEVATENDESRTDDMVEAMIDKTKCVAEISDGNKCEWPKYDVDACSCPIA